jgi:hypothetical protein
MDWFRRKGVSRATTQTYASGAKKASDATHEDILSSPGVLVPSAASLRVEAGRDLPLPSARDVSPSIGTIPPEHKVHASLQQLPTDEEIKSGYQDPLKDIPSYRMLQETALRFHTGIVDQAALTTLPPSVVLTNVISALLELQIEFKHDGDARLRCTRVRKEDPADLLVKAQLKHSARGDSFDKRLVCSPLRLQ